VAWLLIIGVGKRKKRTKKRTQKAAGLRSSWHGEGCNREWLELRGLERAVHGASPLVRPRCAILSGLGGLGDVIVEPLLEPLLLVVIAAEEDGRGTGRIRMSRVADASAPSLQGFIRSVVVPGSRIHTDGWDGYAGLSVLGYTHAVTVLRGLDSSAPAKLLPRVHRVAALLKRWRNSLAGCAHSSACFFEDCLLTG